jgi:hypothetical protein
LPDRPAPSISASRLEDAERHYLAAREKANDAKRATSQGERVAANEAARAAWDEMEKLEASLREFTGWLEEATLGDWAIPGDYIELQQRLQRYDALKVHIKKMPKAAASASSR